MICDDDTPCPAWGRCVAKRCVIKEVPVEIASLVGLGHASDMRKKRATPVESRSYEGSDQSEAQPMICDDDTPCPAWGRCVDKRCVIKEVPSEIASLVGLGHASDMHKKRATPVESRSYDGSDQSEAQAR